MENLEILSLAKQSQAQLLFAESDLNGVNSLTLNLSDAATGVTGSTDNITFDLSYQTVRGFAGSWIDAGDIADLMNIGVIVGTNASTGEVLNLSQLGGFASGKDGNLNISLSSSSSPLHPPSFHFHLFRSALGRWGRNFFECGYVLCVVCRTGSFNHKHRYEF